MAKTHNPRFLERVNSAKEQINEMTPEELRNRMSEGEIVLIDVREDNEFARSHIDGAQHLGKGIIERDIEDEHPDRYAPIALYCGGGYRSALAAEQLQKMGYEKVYSVAGGFRALKEAGFAVEDGSS